MIGLPSRPKLSLGVRILGWTGTWCCSAVLLPLLAWLTLSVRPLRPLPLPAWGSPLFWGLLSLDVFIASLMTFGAWAGRNRPVVRRPPAAKLAPLLGIILFLLVPVLASPGGTIHWRGLLGGMAASIVLFWLAGRFGALVLPPRLEVSAQAWSPPPPTSWPSLPVASSPSPPATPWSPVPATSWPPPPAWQTASVPPNPHRAWASETDVVYSRPRSSQMTMRALSLIPLWLMGSCALCIPLVLFSSGPHTGALAGIFGLGGVMGLVWLMVMLPGMGPQELHVRRQERAYRLRSGTEWGPAFLPGTAGPTRLTWPWRIVERFGTADEFTGVGMLTRVVQRSRYTIVIYSVMLRWTDPTRTPMPLGSIGDEARARAWQAQAAEDLGVPLI